MTRLFHDVDPRAKRLSGMRTYTIAPDPAKVTPLVPVPKLKDQINQRPAAALADPDATFDEQGPDGGSGRKLDAAARPSSSPGRPASVSLSLSLWRVAFNFAMA